MRKPNVEARRRRAIKVAALGVCRAFGLFALARLLTRRKLRILCYHGFAVGDQHEFQPFLFMRPETFRRRLEIIKRMRMPVVTLQEGLARLEADGVRRGEVVLTIDDGWKSTLTLAAPILKQYQLPACLYVATYYCEQPTDVFNVAVRYMIWKSPLDALQLSGIDAEIDGSYNIKEHPEQVSATMVRYFDRVLDRQGRQAMLAKLALALNVDLADTLRDGRFRFLDATDLAALAAHGVDVQLHTHRHRMPASPKAAVAREIEDNRAALQRLLGKRCDHFCYPSGAYTLEHPAWLTELGVVSSTTCDPGFNDTRTPRHLLRRLLDRDDAHDLEFEAELSGFGELFRRLRAVVFNRPPQPEAGGHPVPD